MFCCFVQGELFYIHISSLQISSVRYLLYHIRVKLLPGFPLLKLKFSDSYRLSYVLKFRVRSQQLSTEGLTALTYSDEFNQGVVEEGSFRQEEAAPWTQVMEEEQVLLLNNGKGLLV